MENDLRRCEGVCVCVCVWGWGAGNPSWCTEGCEKFSGYTGCVQDKTRQNPALRKGSRHKFQPPTKKIFAIDMFCFCNWVSMSTCQPLSRAGLMVRSSGPAQNGLHVCWLVVVLKKYFCTFCFILLILTFFCHTVFYFTYFLWQR